MLYHWELITADTCAIVYLTIRLCSEDGSYSSYAPVSCVPGMKICLSNNGDSSVFRSDIQVGSVCKHDDVTIVLLFALTYATQKPRHFLVYPKSWDGGAVSWEFVSTQPEELCGWTTKSGIELLEGSSSKRPIQSPFIGYAFSHDRMRYRATSSLGTEETIIDTRNCWSGSTKPVIQSRAK